MEKSLSKSANKSSVNQNSASQSKVKPQESSGRVDFVGKVGLFGGLSALLVVISLIYLAVHGVSWGIDFKGGTEMQVKFGEPVTVHQVRQVAEKLKLGEVGIQGFSEQNEYVIRFQGQVGKTDKETNEMLNVSIAKLREAINTELGSFKPDIRRVDTVGPQVGAELKRNGFLA
ncbi:MAG: hypothetical protein ACXWRA_09220, partial [Pseudobdellovibrionaceae bacterium]